MAKLELDSSRRDSDRLHVAAEGGRRVDHRGQDLRRQPERTARDGGALSHADSDRHARPRVRPSSRRRNGVHARRRPAGAAGDRPGIGPDPVSRLPTPTARAHPALQGSALAGRAGCRRRRQASRCRFTPTGSSGPAGSMSCPTATCWSPSRPTRGVAGHTDAARAARRALGIGQPWPFRQSHHATRDSRLGTAAPSGAIPLLWGLNQPVGMLYLDGWLYVANTDELVRYPFRRAIPRSRRRPRRVLELPAGGYNNHWTRNVVANADGTEAIRHRRLRDQRGRPRGSTPGTRAAPRFSSSNPDGSGMRVFASGLRNPLGLDWAPGTRTLWTVVNERDGLGDDLVPDYLTSVRDGAFYGWPYAYWGRHEDPRQRGGGPTWSRPSVAPDFALGAHTASLGLAFYRGRAFPERYRGGAFIGQRGSWNRSGARRLPRAVRAVRRRPPSGPAEDFLAGSSRTARRHEVYGRPVGVVELPDGRCWWRTIRPIGSGGWSTRAMRPAARRWRGEDRRRSATGSRGRSRCAGTRTSGCGSSATSTEPGRRTTTATSAGSAADGRMQRLRFIAGGTGGVVLHAPKGMAITGDTLWVTDLDAVRGFHRRTGRGSASIDLQPLGALFLNDITVGPDGALYVTDTGVRFDTAADAAAHRPRPGVPDQRRRGDSGARGRRARRAERDRLGPEGCSLSPRADRG